MTKVIQTLNKGNNISALESPTGTGKTLCLLCSVLGWLQQKKDKNENINIQNVYYCTKTVSQISNVLNELSETCYEVKNSFLASRKFSCNYYNESKKPNIDPFLLNEICLKARAKNKKKNIPDCQYYSRDGIYDYKGYDKIKDIEDLFKGSREEIFCPYYYNINKTKEYADLTIMSYNYILNPFIRKKLDLIENNSIIILDEAHNICSIFESLFSKKLEEKSITELQDALQTILNDMDCSDNEKDKIGLHEINEEINKIKNFIKKLDKTKCMIQEKENIINKDENEVIFLCSLEEFKNQIFKNFSFQFYDKMEFIINNLIEISDGNEAKLKEYTSIKKVIKKMLNFLKMLSFLNADDDSSYRFTLTYSQKDEIIEIIFDIHCVDASYGMKNFMKINPYSVILTSGTLSINMLEKLLQVKFYKTLNNKHVVKNDQFLMNIIEGNMDMDYYFYYNNRKKEKQIISLGNEIVNLAKSVKIGGILVFFQSYDFLMQCRDIWLKLKIFDIFKKKKAIIYDLNNIYKNIEDEIKKTKDNKNMLLFTVYRGKSSEGINFKHDAARMVICLGIPFPNISDIKVRLKKDFLDERNEKYNTGYKSEDWYREEAYVAINQSLGRLIRSKDDYGIMICFGKEFQRNSLFSEWIKPNEQTIRMNEDNKEYYKYLEDFLDNLRIKYKSDKAKDINDIKNSENKKYDYNESDDEDKEEQDSLEEINLKYLEDERVYDEEQLNENEKTIITEIKEEEEDDLIDENSNLNILGHKSNRYHD